jgi:hypothetical protein
MELLLHLHEAKGTIGTVAFIHLGPEEAEHAVCRYQVQYLNAGELLKGEVEHRFADGPWVLVRKAMRALALGEAVAVPRSDSPPGGQS